MIHIPGPRLASRPIDRLLSPIQRFLAIEAAGGILLLACTVIALVWANSPWAESYDTFWHTYLKLSFGEAEFKISLAHFVNDGLMAIFFFVVGLEIKREMLVGELATIGKAAGPIAAAIGGMVVPALFYVVLASMGDEEKAMRGWAIPMATDIAFAVGIMAMLGKRVPLTLKVFLTALAIVDDIGAVLVIAFFYTDHISILALSVAGGVLVASGLCNRLGVRTPIVYGLLGIILWAFLLESGVHATIGGVLLALTIPARVRVRGRRFTTFARTAIDKFEAAGGSGQNILTNPKRQGIVYGLERACEHVQTPVNRLEHELHGIVAFAIMPIFALANAGVPLGSEVGEAVSSSVGLGVALGLVVGKPVGILLFTWAAVKAGVASLPAGSNWKQVTGAGFLAGIGFTMSLFITNLAFRDVADCLQYAKVGILGGSLIAGIAGFILLRTSRPEAGAGEE